MNSRSQSSIETPGAQPPDACGAEGRASQVTVIDRMRTTLFAAGLKVLSQPPLPRCVVDYLPLNKKNTA